METLSTFRPEVRLPSALDSNRQHTRSVKLTTLQGVRGASALMVVLFHATGMVKGVPSLFRYAFGWGYCGVDFFFVLSGFILLYVHYGQVGHPEELGSYFGKRFSRIFPAYWAVLAFVVPTCLLVSGMVGPQKKNIGYIVASFLLLPQWDPFLGVAWSLSCEVFFYLIFALLLLNRRSFGVAVVIWLALVATSFVYVLPYPLDFLCQARVLEFFAGLCVAWAIREGFRYTSRTAVTLIAAGIGICLTAGCVQMARGFSNNVYPLWFGLAAALVISSLVSLELCGSVSAGKVWLLLGDASYSIYLVHYPLLLVTFKLLARHASPQRNWLLGVIVAIVGGIAFHLLIEQRVCGFAKAFLDKKPRGEQSPVLAAPSKRVLA